MLEPTRRETQLGLADLVKPLSAAGLRIIDQHRLEFRLTVGLRKIDGTWRVMHEHHSLPAT